MVSEYNAAKVAKIQAMVVDLRANIESERGWPTFIFDSHGYTVQFDSIEQIDGYGLALDALRDVMEGDDG